MKGKILIAAIVLAGLGAGMLTGILHRNPELEAAVVFDTPRDLPALDLIDQDGVALTTDRFRERWDLFFFGFTRCPDICPMTLGHLRTLTGKLPTGRSPRVWLATVDPEHDTPAVLKDYLSSFNADFAGITGTEQAISELAGALGVPYARIPEGDSYTMTHSSALFLIDPDGRYAGLLNTPHEWETILGDLKRLIR